MIARDRRRINDGINQMTDVLLFDDIVQVESEAVLILRRVHFGVVKRELAFLFFAADSVKRKLAPIRTERNRATNR